MENKELIEIARNCYAGVHCDYEYDCPFYDSNECRQELNKQLADKLEMAIADIAKNCNTCMHRGKSYKEPPCSICKPLEHTKWEWRGDAE